MRVVLTGTRRPDGAPVEEVMSLAQVRLLERAVACIGPPWVLERIGRGATGLPPPTGDRSAITESAVRLASVGANSGTDPAVWWLDDPADLGETGEVIAAIERTGLDWRLLPGPAGLHLPTESGDWHRRFPLSGLRIALTRPESGRRALAEPLEMLGAVAVAVPSIRFEPPSDGGAALQAVLGRLDETELVVLTSPRGVVAMFGAMHQRGLDARALGGCRLAAIGPGTAAALRSHSLLVDVLPERFVAESLLEAIGAPPTPRSRVALIRAEQARAVLPDGLARFGWEVDVVPAYRTLPAAPDDELDRMVSSCDVVTFTSSSTVTACIERFGIDGLPSGVACIGPVTAATVEAAGLSPTVVAHEHSVDGLVRAIGATWGWVERTEHGGPEKH